uniref:abnormal spindle-like microcephaly-associated protein homolog isoform X1 n=1 Tax=Myxine glutinosa TaxID=7769 RepID=UPI00359009EA
MNLRQRIQAGHKNERSVELSHRSCPHGKLHGQQSNGTQNRTANTPSLEQHKLLNYLNKGHCHQSDKSLNQQVSLASPYKSAKRFQQGDAREITKKEDAHCQSQVKELLKRPHSEFDRPGGLINVVGPIMVYHVTNNACGTGMKKSISPGSVNTVDRDVGAIQASNNGHVIRDDSQKQHQSATTIQANYRGYQTRKHLMKRRDEHGIVTFQDELADYKVTNHVDSSQSSSRSSQGCSSKPSSRTPCFSPKYDRDSDLEDQRRVQLGKLIRPRSEHDGGAASRDTSLKNTKTTSPLCDDVVSSHGLDRSVTNSHFLVDPAKEEAVVTIQAGYRGYRDRNDFRKKRQSATTIQTNYRGYQTRKHLKNSRDEHDIFTFQDESSNCKVTSHVISSRSSSRSSQGYSSRPSSRNPCLIRENERDSALEDQRRLQQGKLIRPRSEHDGGAASRVTSLKNTKTISPLCDDAVSSHGLDRSGMNSHFLVDPVKEEAVVTIQAGYRGYRARNDFRKKWQSATTIQANFRGYQARKHLMKRRDEHGIVTFQYEPADYKVTNHVDSSQSSSRSSQGYSSKPSSRTPCFSPKYDRDSALEEQRRVQLGKLIRPRLGHDGGTTSRDTSLKTTKTTSARYYDVVFFHGLDRSGMNGHLLVDPAKEEAVVTIQAGYRRYRARNDFRKKRKSATTIQTDYRGYQTRKHPMKSRDEHGIVTFQDEPADYKAANHVDSSRSSSRSSQGRSSRQSSRSPRLSSKYD